MELNERQQKAVEATEGRVRVVAGAGSGKTRVLAHRFAYLVNELGISPSNILCLTFTNKAAQEMKRRIARMVDSGSVNDFVCTIHSFCVKFLRKEIYRIGYPKNFTIIDEEDAKTLAKQTMQEWGINRKKTTAERFIKSVAAFKGYDPNAYIQRHLLPGSSDECPDAVIRFIRLQLKTYALDFDDLLYFTVYILTHFKDAKDYWVKKLNYIMVDEVQDLSGDDWKLLDILHSYHRNLFVVGDPDQAIYEWRGGNPAIFVGFEPDTDIILNRNYRSTPDILDVANSIIANNKNRIPKELFTLRLNERKVVYRHCKSEKEEAQQVAETIEERHAKGLDYSKFAVVYRASYLSRQIEQALLKRKIPYSVWGGVRFFERKEIKDVLAYLRLIASDADDISLARIINLPPRKFGEHSVGLLRQEAEKRGKPLYPVLKDLAQEGVKPFNKPGINEFIRVIEYLRSLAPSLPISELTDKMMKLSGLEDMYRTDEQEERLENITELVASMKEFELTRYDESDSTLDHYLQEISLFTNPDMERDDSSVRLMTIHQSKGLEFPVVFIVGLTEGTFPNHRSIRERRKDGEEEERRLMYVAVTRAEDVLYLSESEGFMNDTGAHKYPSRFITEIDLSLLDVEGNPDPKLLEGTKTAVDILNAEVYNTDNEIWPAGTRVHHKAFGDGVIKSYDSAAKSYLVRFPTCERQLIPKVLTKL
ncbi:MAG: UvrD-helicase domain-containing protein [Muribaculaceae bacterium]|nr:UvrD-helicase domain-containing protein [Muribaculaceae bacterium]